MKKYGMFFVIVAALFAGLMPALAPKPEFNGSLHAKQLAFVAIATVLANPIAQAAQAFTAPGRKDIKNDSGIAARSKRAGRELAQLKSWISPYVALWKAVRSPSTREATKGQMILAAIKQHKTFSACALILGVDVAVVTGLLLKHLYADLPAWEKLSAEEKAQARRELEEKIKKLKKEMGEADAEADLSSFEQEKLDAELVRLAGLHAEKLIKEKERSDLEEKIKALRAELKEAEGDLAGLDLISLQAEFACLNGRLSFKKIAKEAADRAIQFKIAAIQRLEAELKSDAFDPSDKNMEELDAKLSELKRIKAERDAAAEAKAKAMALRKAKQEEEKKRAADEAEPQRLAFLPQVQALQVEVGALFAGTTVPDVVNEDISALDLPKLQKKQAALLKMKAHRTKYLQRVKAEQDEKAEAEAARAAKKAAKAQREQEEREAAAKAERDAKIAADLAAREKKQAEDAQRTRTQERDTLKKGMTPESFPEALRAALSGTAIPLLAIDQKIDENSDALPKPGANAEFHFALAKGDYFWRPTAQSLWIKLVGKPTDAGSAFKVASEANRTGKFKKS